jgi:hypothetical protein
MGFFKELKDMKENTKGYKRPGLVDSMKQANQAIADVNQQQATASELLTTGVDGTATIGQIMHTGKTVNMMPEISFEMTVSVGGASPVSVQHVQTISPVSIPQIQPGMTVPVKVDPNDPNKVFITV